MELFLPRGGGVGRLVGGCGGGGGTARKTVFTSYNHHSKFQVCPETTFLCRKSDKSSLIKIVVVCLLNLFIRCRLSINILLAAGISQMITLQTY